MVTMEYVLRTENRLDVLRVENCKLIVESWSK